MTSPITKAFQYVWLTLSFLALLVLVSPFFLPADTLFSIARWFQLPHHSGQECSLCGMTRAFLAISQGDFDQAIQLNSGSIPLYGIMVATVFSGVIFFILRWIKPGSLSLNGIPPLNSKSQL